MSIKIWILIWTSCGLISSGRTIAGTYPGSDTVKRMLVTYDLEYVRKMNDHQQLQSLKLDVYEQPKGIIKRPVIILVHGGGFGEGDKQEDLFVKMATAFAKQGYLVFVINYRLKARETPCGSKVLENALSDVSDAVHWIKTNRNLFEADTARMIICGDSAGGAIAVNMCFDNAKARLFAACIDLWGGMCNPRGSEYSNKPPWSEPVYAKQLIKEIPPVCIIHGSSDKIVPFSTSKELAAHLTEIGVYNELHSLEGADHFPENKANEFIPIMIAFSDKVISGKAN